MNNMPYYAYVTFTSTQMSFYGGGALISTSHVLTCAANIKGWEVKKLTFRKLCSNVEYVLNRFTSWTVGLGSNRRVNHVTLNSNRAVSHPDFVEINNFRTNDIGIIFLQQPAEISESVYPIFLPPMNDNSDPMLGIQGMVLGFAGNATTGNEGLQILQAAHVRTIDHNSCLQHYALADKNYQFCAEDVEQGSNFCLGDQVNN